MSLAIAILFTLLLSAAESLWLFALSAHIARFMEKAAPIYWIASLGGLWAAYFHVRSLARLRAALRVFMVAVALMASGVVLGIIAIMTA